MKGVDPEALPPAARAYFKGGRGAGDSR
jgi:hypothetical protein